MPDINTRNEITPDFPGNYDNHPGNESEEQRIIPIPQPAAVRLLAHFFSYIFHPLFIPAYISAFLIFMHPYAFSGFDEKVKALRLVSVVLLTAFFPAFTVFLLYKLGFARSIFLNTRKERIIPYVASMFFFFWIFYVSRNLPDSPPIFITLLLGVFISSITAMMANIYFKVSMHAMAMGGMVTFFVLLSMQGNFAMGTHLSVATLVAGIVCTSRLIVSDHYPFEVYAGCILGIFSQWIAVIFI